MKRLLLKSLLSCAALLAICAPASATITWLGCVSNPADDAAQSDGSTTPSTAVAVDPSSLSMQSGDTAIIFGYTRQLSSTRHVSIVNAGGQTWTETEPTLADQATGGIPHFARATFNGTWSANPSVQVDVGTGSALGLVLCGIRPSGNPLAVDQALAFTVYSAPSTPFTVTRVGQTPTNASSITIATFWSIDNNTWDSLTGGWTDGGTKRNSQGTGYSIKPVYKIQSSAAATGSVSANQATLGGDAGFTSVITFSEPVPVFTSAPAIGTRTSSTIPINFTLDMTGTVYGIAQATGGSAPSCTQIKAGQSGAGGTALYSWSEAVTATVADSHTFTVSSSPYDLYFCGNHSTNGDSAVASITSAYKLPAWTVSPTISARTSTTHTFSYTLDGAGTVYGVDCPKGQTAPTVAQVKLGQCTGSVAATASCNEAVSSSADTTVCTAASPLLVYDAYMVAVYGSQDSALTTLATEIAGAATNYDAPAALGTICTASPCPVFVYNASVATDIIATDYFSCKNITEPDSLAITWTNDGNFTYAPTSARELLHCKYQDVSAFGMFSGANPADFYVNNLAPFASPSTINEVWYIGDALSRDYATLFTDPEDDTLTCTQDSTGTGAGDNKRPTGSSFSTVAISGTVTTAQSGAFTVTCADIAGDSGALEVNWEVRALPVAPDCTTSHLTFAACTDLTQAAFIDWDISGTACSTASIASGSIYSQSPTAGTTMDPGDVLNLVVARGCSGGGKWRLNLDLRL